MSTQKLIAGKSGKDATHSGGRGEIFHDWFPYLEGFSSNFVLNLLEKYLPHATQILEPFCGVGTTPITLAQKGISTAYCEVNPVLRHLVSSKVETLKNNDLASVEDELVELLKNLRKLANKEKKDKKLQENYKACFEKSQYFYEDNFKKILLLKSIERKLTGKLKDYFAIAVYSSLLESSLLKRAGDVRFRTEKDLAKGVPDIFDVVEKKLKLIIVEIAERIAVATTTKIELFTNNAKNLKNLKNLNTDGVITSPPYLNGTNYFRNTRLELWYQEEITTSNSLRLLRDEAITAGINDVTKNSGLLVLPEVTKYYKQISEVCYDSRIPKMVAAYFNDMKDVFEGIRNNVVKNGVICIDIGDSIYSNVHIPTHAILEKIALSIGWSTTDEIILRERYSNNGSKLTQRLLVFKNEK